MSQLETQMRHRDREMVPRFLVVAMFCLMGLSVAIVSYAQLTGRPNVGVLVEAPVVAERTITLTGDRSGTYVVTDAEGRRLAASDEALGGFYGVIGRVIDRRRQVHGIEGNPHLTIVRRENGNVAVLDPATDFTIELIGYGADNVAAFARLVD